MAREPVDGASAGVEGHLAGALRRARQPPHSWPGCSLRYGSAAQVCSLRLSRYGYRGFDEERDDEEAAAPCACARGARQRRHEGQEETAARRRRRVPRCARRRRHEGRDGMAARPPMLRVARASARCWVAETGASSGPLPSFNC